MQNEPPLCVDLDGTITLVDTLLIGVVLFIRKNPLNLFKLLYWLRRGKPYMKEQLSQRVLPDPKDIPYNTDFLIWLRNEKQRGRKIVLATAANHHSAQPIAEYLQLFDKIVASPADDNLKATRKASALNALFGQAGYDYAGNSKDDLLVWPNARRAIVVNPDATVRKRSIDNLSKSFPPVKISYFKLLRIKPYRGH